MALATKCPHCQTTFRVAHDQLKLRAGLVRCGACKEVFNGIEHLLRPAEQAVPVAHTLPAEADRTQAEPAAAAAPTTQVTAEEASADSAPANSAPAFVTPLHQRSLDTDAAPLSGIAVSEADSTDQSAITPVEEASPPGAAAIVNSLSQEIDPAASIESAALASSLDFDIAPANQRWPLPTTPAATDADPAHPLERMTLMDFTDRFDDAYPDEADPDPVPTAEAIGADVPDPLDKAIDDLQRKPWRGEGNVVDDPDDPETLDADVPGFVRRGRRQQRVGRKLRLVMASGSLVLLMALAAQGAYVFRNVLAATVPTLKPMLVAACGVLDCAVGLPAQIDTLSIESSELQITPPARDAFMLSMLLRNRSSTVQDWPNIELTLNDANDKPIGRRVFLPRDYLAAAVDLSKGFMAASEQSIKVNFELTQLKAAGFKVYLFYS
ncbi:MAG: zinc-ribbon domain-containing protein [Herminiimonas sp.]|nr:zinc-ribbon domain-containing protein [Herminiimonas sp.]